ncbi:F-box/kelch-repeat protein At3g06240-like [Beta vulgaris subsp. vulgaris]|uniref:F-box/kelch-repeat protein At3g06240-like n=1 Tax=Beta vulgaris subsp. vulgaris TaxID=3555 RepID=UPI002037342E|nr:F-box/kelch-repeat protein At3g06240-like [Beta vulgaris subsp. vulgaris]
MVNDYKVGKKYYLLSLSNECSNVKELVGLECKYKLMIAPRRRSTVVIGSINGLVCLYDQVSCFYLWNPATHQRRKVDNPFYQYRIRDYIKGVGFGYISSMNDYRIGCISWSYDEEVYHVDVFSLSTGKWKRTATLDDDYYFSMARTNISVLIEGCLSLGGISNLNGYHVCDVWMLKQHDDDSWEKFFSINIGKDTRLLYLFDMGKCLVGDYYERLKLLDSSKVTQEECEENTVICEGSKEGTLTPITDAWGYVESLISPFGRIKYDEDEDYY